MTRPIVPVTDALTAPFWDGSRRHELIIQRCQKCGSYAHPPRPVCRACRSFDLAFDQVSGRGTLYSFTETRKVFHPCFADRVPYLLAVVELEEQSELRVLANFTGAPGFDMPVEVSFEDLSEEVTVPVFRPATP